MDGYKPCCTERILRAVLICAALYVFALYGESWRVNFLGDMSFSRVTCVKSQTTTIHSDAAVMQFRALGNMS